MPRNDGTPTLEEALAGHTAVLIIGKRNGAVIALRRSDHWLFIFEGGQRDADSSAALADLDKSESFDTTHVVPIGACGSFFRELDLAEINNLQQEGKPYQPW